MVNIFSTVLESADSITSSSSTQPEASKSSNDTTAYVVVLVFLVVVLVVGGVLFSLLLLYRSRKQRGSLDLRSDTVYTVNWWHIILALLCMRTCTICNTTPHRDTPGLELTPQNVSKDVTQADTHTYSSTEAVYETIDSNCTTKVKTDYDYTQNEAYLTTVREEGMTAVREEGVAAVREEGVAALREEGMAAVREEGVEALREEGVVAVREGCVTASVDVGTPMEGVQVDVPEGGVQ